MSGVYPRVCGETTASVNCQLRDVGLSPRVRGNLQRQPGPCGRRRSIPACAGKPGPVSSVSRSVRVYPRVCGETGVARALLGKAAGLSPRVRGNLRASGRRGAIPGSIPACAGKPPPARQTLKPEWVYPRVCGETASDRHRDGSSAGLSPRVRGNLRVDVLLNAHIGSIPACAGKPRLPRAWTVARRVYPRVCGETAACRQKRQPLPGLSPRVRGNRQHSRRRDQRRGSIPACAGKPKSRIAPRPITRVYPRVCGETLVRPGRSVANSGLSPRVRGNRTSALDGSPFIGSIPACAGKPLS